MNQSRLPARPPSLPKANRQYVAPLLLQRGRGKKLKDLHSSKTVIGERSNAEKSSKFLKNNEGSAIPSKRHGKTVTGSVVGNDEEDTFDPLFAPPPSRIGEMPMNDQESSFESLHFTADNEHLIGPDSPEHDLDEDNNEHLNPPEHDLTEDNNNQDLCNSNDNMPLDANDNVVESSPTTEQGGNATQKKVDNEKRRGRNKCKEIAKLKPGEKLEITFYNNRAVGKNHKVFARHLGIIVRDTYICPVKVHKWKDIADNVKDHMWSAVTDVFSHDNLQSYRDHVLDHMKELWTNWRSDLLRYNVTKKKITLQAALKNKPPNGLNKNECQWLIKEIYSNPEFKKASVRNSVNRANYLTPLSHRTGSKPFRELMWDDLGASKGLQPKLIDVFHLTRKKGDSLPNEETTKKYNEIRETMEKEPALSNVEVAQKVFSSKSRDRVVCIGGGMKLKDIRGPQPSREELVSDLNVSKKQNEALTNHVEVIQEENKELKDRMSSMETRMKMFQDMLAQQLNISLPSNPPNELNSQGT